MSRMAFLNGSLPQINDTFFCLLDLIVCKSKFE